MTVLILVHGSKSTVVEVSNVATVNRARKLAYESVFGTQNKASNSTIAAYTFHLEKIAKINDKIADRPKGH